MVTLPCRSRAPGRVRPRVAGGWRRGPATLPQSQPGFNPVGKSIHALAPAFGLRAGIVGSFMAIQPDGKIILVGGNSPNTSYGELALVRLNANGALDTSFGSRGKVTMPAITLRNGPEITSCIENEGTAWNSILRPRRGPGS
jgi:hypothetical protein